MKPQTKQKKYEEKRRALLETIPSEEAQDLVDKYFPKGNKKRGEALAILALGLIEGFNAGEKLGK